MLLFRVGDFYETFGDDAVTASKILNITLTKRGNGSASETHLAGFPHHSLDVYMPKLVRAGQRVAICDQLEDPKDAVGIVKRGVTELITPGLLLADNVLESSKNNYLASVHYPAQGLLGLALIDVSTGEFLAAEGDVPHIEKLLQTYNPSEVLYCRQRRQAFTETFGTGYSSFTPDDWVFSTDFAYDRLCKQFQTKNLKGFGIEEMPAGIIAAGAILWYLNETEHKELGHLRGIARLEQDRYVWMDRFTLRNLELLFPQQEGGIPLISVLDRTSSPMGARMLRNWLLLPLKHKPAIEERLQITQTFVNQPERAADLRGCLKNTGDLERLAAKAASLRINPRELGALKRALEALIPIKQLLSETKEPLLLKWAADLNPCAELLEQIENTLSDEAPALLNAGNVIKSSASETLYELRGLLTDGKDYLQQVQVRETANTGISSLKVAFNKVFGYYLEVTHAHRDKVPPEWIRKQTLVNAERYITPELKEYEEKIMGAEAAIAQIEYKMFSELVAFTVPFVPLLQANARLLAQTDCLLGFALLAQKNNYCRPVVNEGRNLVIKAGRHPVIELQLPAGESYVPNDISLNDTEQQILIITGPNMAGKSALLRQTALITIMAQIGCFVPAESAEIGIADKIFTRVGAGDNISRGESTFMVEMTETAGILNNLGPSSLLLMDEIGRGTGTFDGVSLAWSIVEYLHNHPQYKPRTLFATHYHELNELEARLPRVHNFNVQIKEAGNKILFMRKLLPGGGAHSFGIHVAQMAGMPNGVVLRASEVMKHLESGRAAADEMDKIASIPAAGLQLSFFDAANRQASEAEKMLREIDINSISPLEALLKLNELKKILLPEKPGKAVKK